MFVAFLIAMCVASQLKPFRPVFRGSSEPLGVVIGAAVIFTVGMVDDLREVSAPAKMSGQVLAGTLLYFSGLTMLFFRVPLVGTTVVLSSDLAPLLTVIWVVSMANAVNLIDGLDGLAAGIVAIASAAFFLYSHQLFRAGNISVDNSGPLVAVICLGLCLGFLPHNFHPARIFMGDAGAMLLGLLVAASTLSVVGQTDQPFSGRTYFFFAPIFIPFFILGIPMLDTAFAIVQEGGPPGQSGGGRQGPPPPPPDAPRPRSDPLGAHPLGLDGAAVGPGALPHLHQEGQRGDPDRRRRPRRSPSTPFLPHPGAGAARTGTGTAATSRGGGPARARRCRVRIRRPTNGTATNGSVHPGARPRAGD